jgi:hypothetical protein
MNVFRDLAKAAGMTANEIERITRSIEKGIGRHPIRQAAQARCAQLFKSDWEYFLRSCWGEWVRATGPGQITGIQQLMGPPTVVPRNHIGPIRASIVELFGGPGGLERVLAGTQDLPPLARGGVVLARAGGTAVRIGEGGHDEAVIPLPQGWQGGRSQRPVTIKIEQGAVQVKVEGDGDEIKIKDAVNEALDEFIERLTSEIGREY